MKQYGFYFDASRCTGCKACQIACADKNGLEDGRFFRNVLPYESGSWREDRATGAWHQDVFAYYLSIACNHCEDPACVKVCPTKAHFKRKEDGLVVIDREKCIGCGACTAVCTAGNLTEFNFRKVHTLVRRGEYQGAYEEMNKCMLCGKCRLVCPRGINTRGVVMLIKRKLGDF